MENTTDYLSGMVVLNTLDQSAINISTSTLGAPRVAGGLEYIEGIGKNGVLVALGGVQRTQAGEGKPPVEELASATLNSKVEKRFSSDSYR